MPLVSQKLYSVVKHRNSKLTWNYDSNYKLSKMFKVSWGQKDVFDNETYLWACQVSDVGEPVDMSTTMVKCMNELMSDHSVHMGLITNIILAQNNLGGTKTREVRLFLQSTLISRIPSSVSPEGRHLLGLSLHTLLHWPPHPPMCQGPVLTTNSLSLPQG